MDLITLTSIFPSIQKQYLEEFLRSHPNPQEGIEGLFNLQDKLDALGSDNRKLLKCIIPNCQTQNCIFFHNFKERRRNLLEHKYEPRPCFAIFTDGSWDFSKKCPKGDSCKYSHNFSEIQLHPEFRSVQSQPYDRKPNMERPFNNFRSRKMNDLRTEIQEIDEYMTEKRIQLNEVQEQISTLTKLANCYKCERNLIEYALACGHLFCEKCKAVMNNSCSICSKRFDFSSAVKLAP